MCFPSRFTGTSFFCSLRFFILLCFHIVSFVLFSSINLLTRSCPKIWKIWPAVLLHTLFASGVVYIWVATNKTLEIPNVMLTVMGAPHFPHFHTVLTIFCRSRDRFRHIVSRNERVRLFFLLPRISSSKQIQIVSYDRYWMGRSAWTDVIRNARTMGRLIWYHVPLRLTTLGTNTDRNPQEMAKVMAEKRMALDLVEACVPYITCFPFRSFGGIGLRSR